MNKLNEGQPRPLLQIRRQVVGIETELFGHPVQSDVRIVLLDVKKHLQDVSSVLAPSSAFK